MHYVCIHLDFLFFTFHVREICLKLTAVYLVFLITRRNATLYCVVVSLPTRNEDKFAVKGDPELY